MHADDRPKQRLSRAWVWAARFPCIILLAWIVILPGIAVSSIWLTDAKNITLESDFESYLSSDEPASTEYDELENLLDGYEAPTAADSSRRALQTTRNADGSDPLVTWREFLEVIYFCGEDCDSILTEERLTGIHAFETAFEADIYSQYCPRKADGVACIEAESILNYFYPTVTSAGLVLDGNGDSLYDIDSVLNLVRQSAQDESDFWYFPRAFLENGGNVSIVRSSFELRFRDRAAMEAMAQNVLLPYLQARKHLSGNVRLLWYNSDVNALEIEGLILHDLQFGAISLVFVLACMIVHSRSVFLSLVACFSIAMSFPITYVIYTLVLGNEVMMIFNFTSVFVLVGIGADDFAIFSDIWAQSRHLADFDLANRLRWTWRRAAGATFVTSVTTAASFLANLASPIQPIREFGQFMGVLVIFNYIFIVLVLPPALVVHDRYLRWGLMACLRRRCACCRSRSTGKDASSGARESHQGANSATSPRKPSAAASFAALSRRPPSLFCGRRPQERADDDEFDRDQNRHYAGSVVSEESVTIDMSGGGSPRGSRGSRAQSRDGSVPSYVGEDPVDDQDFLVRFFYKGVAPFTYRWRYVLLVVFLALTSTLGALMVARVEVSDALPDIFGSETNLGLLLQIRTDYFSDTSIPNSSSSDNDPATVAVCIDPSTGEAVVCGSSAPTQMPTTPKPTRQPTLPPTSPPTTPPTAFPTVRPTSAPTESTSSPTALPTLRPTPQPVTPSPTTIERPANIPGQVLIADGETLVPHLGEDGPATGYISASAGAFAVSSNLCAVFDGEPTQGTAAIAVEAGTPGSTCTLSTKLSNAIDALPSTQLLIAVHGADTESANSTQTSGGYAITVEAGAPLTAVQAASSLTYGPPLVVTFSSTSSRRELQRFGGPNDSRATAQTAAEILANANIDSSLTFEDGSGVTSVVITSYDEAEAESLASDLATASDVSAVEVDSSMPSITPKPTTPPVTPTEAPTVPAPTTPAPSTAAPTTIAPTRFPTSTPTLAPTSRPTTPPLECKCSGNGACASNATPENPACSCYTGWLGDTCNTTDSSLTELSDDQVASVDIWWLRSEVSDMAETQMAMLTMCDAMEAEAASVENPLEVRRVTSCFMSDFAAYVAKEGDIFPLATTGALEAALYDFITTTTEGYNAREMVIFDDDGGVEVVRMTVLTNINELLAAREADDLYQQWEAFVKDVDASARETSFLWARTQTELAVIRGTLAAALISLAFAFAAIFIFTRFNVVVALATTLAIIIVLVLLLSILIVFMGRTFGAIEALSVIILAGLTVDYSLHLAHSFHRARQTTMLGRAQQALGQTGPSVIFGAITTAGAAAILTVCEITLFNDFGMIIAINTALSLASSIFFLIPALLVSYAAVQTLKRALWGDPRKSDSNRRDHLPEAREVDDAEEASDSEYQPPAEPSAPPPPPPPSPSGDNVFKKVSVVCA